MHQLVERIQVQDIRALARAITLVENNHEDKLQITQDAYQIKKNGMYIGLTGSPGAGKSSLVNRLISHIRQEGKPSLLSLWILLAPLVEGHY